MGTDIKRRKIRRLKGSVLFTTLVVMILILLIMLAAIGLAGAASKKAYSTWYDNQTKYTAQDLVDNVIELLGPTSKDDDMKALGKSIVNSLGSKNSSVTVDVKVNGSNKIPGYGEVQSLTFTYVADNGSDFRIIDGHDGEKIIKVSAEVSFGGETSTYSTYAVGSAASNKTNANGGGYIAMSDLKGGSGSNDAPFTIGRFYAGIEERIEATAGGNQITNAGDIFINAKEYHFNANVMPDQERPDRVANVVLGRNDPDNNSYSGMRIEGDLTAQNGFRVQSQYPPSYLTEADLLAEKFYNIPYLYVKGKIEMPNTGITVVGMNDDGTINNTKGLLNIYCGYFNFTGHSALTGNMNIMTMDETATNKLIMNGSKLTEWAASTIDGVNAKFKTKSGNLYSKGNLEVSGNGIEINGDLCVVGNLSASDSGITVNGGNVYVGGSITGQDKVNVIGGGKIVSLGSSGTENFVQKLKDLKNEKEDDGTTPKYPDAENAASRFEEAYKVKGDGANGKEYFQTIDNIKASFITKDKDGNKKYADVIDTSGYAGNEEWNGTGVIVKSCVWKSSTKANGEPLGSGVSKIINIDPGNKDLWINIDPSLETISMATIIVDDTKGGSVKFFLQGDNKLDLKMTKIITKTYLNKLFDYDATNNKYNPKFNPNITLTSYPDDSLDIPHIYMYASTDNDIVITMSDGQYIYTGDIVAPNATFNGGSTNGVAPIVDYTFYRYIDIDGNGKVEAFEKADPIRFKRNFRCIDPITHTPKDNIDLSLCFIGSLEAGSINVTNAFGYLYVDDPPTDGGDPGDTDEFAWQTISGYSTY